VARYLLAVRGADAQPFVMPTHRRKPVATSRRSLISTTISLHRSAEASSRSAETLDARSEDFAPEVEEARGQKETCSELWIPWQGSFLGQMRVA